MVMGVYTYQRGGSIDISPAEPTREELSARRNNILRAQKAAGRPVDVAAANAEVRRQREQEEKREAAAGIGRAAGLAAGFAAGCFVALNPVGLAAGAAIIAGAAWKGRTVGRFLARTALR